jgi:methylated-DNA-[protein]-cysteine S-methyltransferase
VAVSIVSSAARRPASAGADYQATIALPCCVLGIRTCGDAICAVAFLPPSHGERAPANRVAERACAQLQRYLADPQFRFAVPLEPTGSAFQRRVWACIAAVPAGRTSTYGHIAAELGSASRAVGQACGANPYPVFVPCHRVVAANGLGGFAHRNGGLMLSVKRWLLKHEGGLR